MINVSNATNCRIWFPSCLHWFLKKLDPNCWASGVLVFDGIFFRTKSSATWFFIISNNKSSKFQKIISQIAEGRDNIISNYRKIHVISNGIKSIFGTLMRNPCIVGVHQWGHSFILSIPSPSKDKSQTQFSQSLDVFKGWWGFLRSIFLGSCILTLTFC